MNEQQAIARAKKLNATRYKKSRINVAPRRLYGNVFILVGVANPSFKR